MKINKAVIVISKATAAMVTTVTTAFCVIALVVGCAPSAPPVGTSAGAAGGASSDFSVCDKKRCQALWEKNKYLETAGCYECVTRYEPESRGDPEIYYYIGVAYKEAGRFDESIEAFTKAVELAPKTDQYYRLRGSVYRQRGDNASALRDYAKAIEFARTFADNYYLRGETYLALGDCESALGDYEKVLELNNDPKNERYKNAIKEAKEKKCGHAKIAILSESVAFKSKYVLRACVTSEFKVETPAVTVNGRKVRGTVVVGDDGCDLSIGPMEVTLDTGKNVIRIEVVSGNKGSVPSVKNFVVVYNAAADTIAPVDPIVFDGRRAALVIGNNNYKNNPLDGAVKDAEAVSARLENLGFKVLGGVKRNVGKERMEQAINDFADNAGNQKYDVALFYYAGHGKVQDGVNFFLPVDIGNLNNMKKDAVGMEYLMNAMERTKAPMKIVMLDACRDTIGGSGFVNVNKTIRGRGTLIVYATASGKTALDSSAFTRSFLRHVDTPNIELMKLIQMMGNDVERETGGYQMVMHEGSTTGDFYFRPGGNKRPVQGPRQNVVVCVLGNPSNRDILRAAFSDALVNSGEYKVIAVDAIEDIIKEHKRQMDGSVLDSEVVKIGRDAGAKYILVVKRLVDTAASGAYVIEARMVRVEEKTVELSKISKKSISDGSDAADVVNAINIQVAEMLNR